MQDNQLLSLIAAVFYTNPQGLFGTHVGAPDFIPPDDEVIRRAFAKAVDFHARGHLVIQELIRRQEEMERATAEAEERNAERGAADA